MPLYTPTILKLCPPMRMDWSIGLIAPKKYLRMVSPMTQTRAFVLQSVSVRSRPAETVRLVTMP